MFTCFDERSMPRAGPIRIAQWSVGCLHTEAMSANLICRVPAKVTPNSTVLSIFPARGKSTHTQSCIQPLASAHMPFVRLSVRYTCSVLMVHLFVCPSVKHSQTATSADAAKAVADAQLRQQALLRANSLR